MTIDALLEPSSDTPTTLSPAKRPNPRLKPVVFEYAVDSNGSEIVKATIANSDKPLVMEKDAFEALKAQGMTHGWFLTPDGKGRSYARLFFGGRNLMISRVLLDIWVFGQKVRVRYLDGDRLNLRRSNLLASRGASGWDWSPMNPHAY